MTKKKNQQQKDLQNDGSSQCILLAKKKTAVAMDSFLLHILAPVVQEHLVQGKQRVLC